MSEPLHTVLIVDDEQNIVDGLRRTLRHEGYRIITTTSPRDALELLWKDRVDILISDIDMPEMTGLELIAFARRNHPEIVRILLTGDASIESALTAINDGAVHKYLTKPWTSKSLRETLRETILGLDAIRQKAVSDEIAGRDATLRENLAERYPGIDSVSRVDGAYLLNDVRVVELLADLDGQTSVFAAARWLPISTTDATVNVRHP